MSFRKASLIISIIGVVLAALALAHRIYSSQPPAPKPIVDDDDRFYCEFQPETEQGGSVWTVIYRHKKGNQPWLNMVYEFGDGWNTLKRCDEIAKRLAIFREDGLIELSYRSDPNTPQQAVICAKTKISGDNCPLLVTLAPNVDPYNALRKMIKALEQGTAVPQSSVAESLSEFSRDNPVIELEYLLAGDER